MRTIKSPAKRPESSAPSTVLSEDRASSSRPAPLRATSARAAGNQALSTIKAHSLGDVIQQHIQELIFSGEITAGERINEKRLSEQLGVSRAPIREATRALQQLGLVDVINNRGVFVRTVNLKQVIDIFNIRVSLAELAGAEAARRVTDTALAQLANLIERMDRLKNPDEYLQLNLAFHQRIFDLADNQRLASLDEALGMELRLFRLRGLRSAGSMKVSNEEHRGILHALRDRNAEQVGRLFRQHVLAGRDRFLTTVERQESETSRPRARVSKVAI